jgi:hypothetical protein
MKRKGLAAIVILLISGLFFLGGCGDPANGNGPVNGDDVTFTVTVNSAGTDFSGGGQYKKGETVTINAGESQEGYQFKNWTSYKCRCYFCQCKRS